MKKKISGNVNEHRSTSLLSMKIVLIFFHRLFVSMMKLSLLLGEEFGVLTEMLKEPPLTFAPSNHFSVVGIAVGELAP